MSKVTGIHHITVCAAGAQEDIDFMTQVLGQRLIKQTILFDGRYAHYHLYYSNADCEPGSVYTTFPFDPIKGRPGSGQVSSTAYTVPKGTVKFWQQHLDATKTPHEGAKERFGTQYLRFSHPSGLQLEVIEDDADKRNPWTVGEVTKDVATRGFHSAVLSVREVGETKRFFIDALGFKDTGTDGIFHRLEIGKGGAAKTITLAHEPEKPSGSWTFGAGCAHHVALDLPNDEALAEQKGVYDELGYTDCSEIKDRMYFHSIYCRCPGGILVECAATVPGSWTLDEKADELGTGLLLPPWFEEKRAEIVAMLEPIQVPEGNLPKGTKVGAGGIPIPEPIAAPANSSASRRTAEFVKPDNR